MRTTLDIMNELDERVYGNTELKKALLAMLNRSYLRFMQRWYKSMDEQHLISPMKLLVIGPSGSGKTHAIESLRSIVHFPYVRIDATHLLPSGGGSKGVNPKILEEMIIEEAKYYADTYPEQYLFQASAIDRTVVLVDEFDKLGNNWDGGNWNRHVQSNFLTMFDNKAEFAGVSFVFAGAFTELTKKKKENANIGFTKQEDKKEEKPLDEQVLSCGLIPEIVGRINHIIKLDDFTEYDLYQILNNLLIPKKLRDLAAYGTFDVDISEDFKKEIVEGAFKSEQGVRYMQRLLDKKFLDLEFEADVDYIFKGYFNEC